MNQIKLGTTILALVLLGMLTTNQCKGQNKSTFYIKMSPSYLFPKDADNIPAFFAGAGLKVDRYFKLGLAAGYFKFKGNETPFLPLGIDVNICDFNKKRPVLPIAIFQACYPIYKSENYYGSVSSGTSINIASSTTGRFMYKIGGGLAFSINESSKLFITGHFSGLTVKTKTTTKTAISGSPSRTTTNESSDNISISGITIGFIL